MALSATTTLPHSVDSVAAVLVNEDFQRHVSQLVGGNLESFTVDGDVAGAPFPPPAFPNSPASSWAST
jgi:hypothetical protein